MISLNSPAAMRSTIKLLADNDLRRLLEERMEQLAGECEVLFLIVQAGDAIEETKALLGWSPLCNIVDGTHCGHPDFTPSFEWMERHGSGWFEFVYITSDDGSGVAVFVQDDPQVEEQLLAMCREYAP